LKSIAPKANQAVLKKLSQVFSDLRKLQENGTLSYPFSLREAVAVAVHYESYPHAGMSEAVQNIMVHNFTY
jgi:hypothetical protein